MVPCCGVCTFLLKVDLAKAYSCEEQLSKALLIRYNEAYMGSLSGSFLSSCLHYAIQTGKWLSWHQHSPALSTQKVSSSLKDGPNV
jgi:hypothetical protein